MKKPPKTEKHHQLSEARKREFLHLFSREAQYIRDDIAKDLPAYNMLLNAQAESFEEIALRQLAAERNIPFDKDNPPMPTCPHCGKYDRVGTKGEGAYYCNLCKRKLTATHNSISSGTKCDALVWMKVLMSLLNFSSIAKTCEYCEIAPNTYYLIRNRIFYAMQLMMDEVKLYGIIEVDNTFVRASYKGMNLQEQENDFPEESIFFDDRFIPRAARQRGGANLMKERTANSICLFTAIDDSGHVLSRFAGVGATSLRMLQTYIPQDKFLLEVPRKDGFDLFPSKKDNDKKSKPGTASKIVADKERAIENYANFLGIEFEPHKFREIGIQRRLPDGAHNIQRVNALHRRLKDFLRKANYVSTKYLPGYLILFEFMENTKATPEAIARLFQIFATPELGKAPTFYQEMYVVPNYLMEWIDGPNPLKKLPYNKLLAFYLYDHIRRPEAYPGVNISMERIMSETGYTAPTIRRNYKTLIQAGYQENILRYFGEPVQKEKGSNKTKSKKPKKTNNFPATINPIVLAIYDEYAQLRKLPKDQCPSLEVFLKDKNVEYGTTYTRTNMLMKFKKIVELNVRPPLPEPQHDGLKVKNYSLPKYAFSVLDDYDAILLSYRQKGAPLPTMEVIYEQLSEKYKVAPRTIREHIIYARAYRRSTADKTVCDTKEQ